MSSIENDNLLYLLNRWAYRQYENFSTEALAHLIRHLLAYEPSAGVAVLNYLTAGRLDVCVEVAPAIDVSTQVTEEMGRPDIEIKGPNRLAYVEIKLEAGLGHQQLSRYKHQLKQRSITQTALVLVTQYAPPEFAIDECPDVCRRWHELAACIDCLTREVEFRCCDTPFLVRQFLGFLRSKGLVMERVGWELDGGIRAFRNLMMMVETGCRQRRVERSRGKDRGRDYDGYRVTVDGAKTWVGVYYDSPNVLTFESSEWLVVPDAGGRAGFGTVEPSPYTANRIRWVHKLVLDSEEVHFFARSAASQLKCIEEFLESCFQALPKIKSDLSAPGPV